MTNQPSAPQTGSRPDPLRRPRVVTIAYVLWICIGVFLLLGGLGIFAAPVAAGSLLRMLLVAYYIGFGVAILVFAGRLRHGRAGSRSKLQVLGAFSFLTIYPIPLLVAAFILQDRPAADVWFAAVNGRPHSPTDT